MDQDTQKIIADQMKNLPKDVLAAIASVDFKIKLQEITRRQRLLIDQADKLEMETTLVMMGLEPLTNYVENLQREMEVNIIRAKEIATDVSENIFKPIRESLRAMNEEVESEEDVRIMADTIAQENKKEDTELNRDQILSEIEDPTTIVDNTPAKVETKVAANTPKREIETLAEVPYQQDIHIKTENVRSTVPDSFAPKSGLLETKMADITITSEKIVDIAPEIKLPAIEKKRPSGGIDPYREEIK